MLVAICAAGSRQRDAFEHSADDWIDLPAGSFETVGTGVQTAIVVFSAQTDPTSGGAYSVHEAGAL